MTGGETRSRTRDAPVLPFVLAVLIPIIGFVLGVIEAAKRSTARGAAIMLVAVFATVGWIALYQGTSDVHCSPLFPHYCVHDASAP